MQNYTRRSGVIVHILGQGSVTLTQSDYIASGGEGSVWVKGSTAFKVYHDPSKMIPVGKISELGRIADPDVIKPERIILDGKNQPIGYTMRFLQGTLALCQLFPPVFRQRNGISPDMTLALVRALQHRVENVHRAGVLIVDLNELNFLVDPTFREVYAIDVDSYQTAHFPATAIMPSIRDPQVQGADFTQLSDWFSFAIVSFNLFTGIHPYKGQHPSIHGMEDRMQAGISVFNSDVSVPKMVLPFTVIPPSYLQWYRAVLEGGKRLPPPDSIHGTLVIVPVIRAITGAGNLDISSLLSFHGAIRGVWDSGQGGILTWTDEGVFLHSRQVHGPVQGIAGVGFTARMGHPVIAGKSGGTLRLFRPDTNEVLPLDIRADEVSSYDGRIYVRNRDQVLEVLLTEMGQKVIASTRLSLTCLEHASQMFPGVVVQDLLGARWVALLDGPGKVYPLHVPELDGYRVVDARYDRGVLMVVGHKAGKYDRLVFRFDATRQTYDTRVVPGITPTGLNFIVLDSGICVCLTEDEKLELFSARPGSASLKTVEDKALGGDLILLRQGGKVLFWRGNDVYAMRMK
jgi:serine/threonine protein kinase